MVTNFGGRVMLQNKTIAVFIDVDNCALSFDNYKNALDQVASMGKIVSCKLYGVSDRRHREIIADANDNGYDMAFAMRIKKRNTKVFDNRVLVDVVEKVVSNPQIDAVAIVTAPADMVYLYRFLQKREVAVIALDNADEDSVKLVDEILDLGQVQVLKFPSQKPQKTVDDVLEEAVAQPQLTAEEKNAKLQEEIERLRQENGIVVPIDDVEEAVEEVVDQIPVEEPTHQPAVEETPAQENEDVELTQEQPTDEQQPKQTLGSQAQSLLDEIAKLREEEAVLEQPAEEVVDQPEEVQPEVAPDVVSQSSAEDELISQIESLRANLTDESNDEELIAQIKFLLDGLE